MTTENNPYIQKTEDGWKTTDAGREYLEDLVTNRDGNVYALTDKVSLVMGAAAMARLSRSQLDLRDILLSEFTVHPDKAAAVANRVINDYGDDSVKQLATVRVVVENASNLLTKKIEWGRLASYLERSTRYIYYFEKRDGKYQYYVPENLTGQIRDRYVQSMDFIFDRYAEIVVKMTEFYKKKSPRKCESRAEEIAWNNATRAEACDAVRNLLPAATQSTVGIVGSTQAVENLIIRLMAEGMDEYVRTGEDILREVRKVAPVFFEKTDKEDRGVAMSAYRSRTKNAVSELIRINNMDRGAQPNRSAKATGGPTVTLVSATPTQELDIVPHIIFEHSTFSLASITQAMTGVGDAEKRQILTTYIGQRLNRRHRPGRALENIHYTWEIVGDYGSFRDLQRHRMVDDFEWQPLNPHLGYEVPKSVIEAGFEADYVSCLEKSQQLYDAMIKADHEEEAQYAVLFGHHMRYRFTMNAREAFHVHEIRSTTQAHPCYRHIVLEMHRQLRHIHPIIADGMRFVGGTDTPDLVRWESELARQRKLEAMGAANE